MKEITVEFQDENEQVQFVERIQIEDGDKFILTIPYNEQDRYYPISPEVFGKFAKMFRDGLKKGDDIFVLPELMKIKIIRS